MADLRVGHFHFFDQAYFFGISSVINNIPACLYYILPHGNGYRLSVVYNNGADDEDDGKSIQPGVCLPVNQNKV